jgi:hypothetical protein
MGASDGFLYVLNALTGVIEYKLPGQTGSVLATHFHPQEPVIASTGLDGKTWVGEL